MKDAKGHGSAAHQSGVEGATKPIVHQLAEQIMKVYHSEGPSAAMKLRDQLIEQHKIKTYEYAVLVDQMRKLR